MAHYLIAAFFGFSAGIYVLLSKSKAPKSTAFLLFCIGSWSLELFFLSYIDNKETLFYFFHISRWGMFFMPAGFMLLASQFIPQTKSHKYLVLYPTFAVSLALCIYDTFIDPSELRSVPGGYLPEVNMTYKIFVGLAIYALPLSIFYCIRQFKKSKKRDKHNSLWWAFFGAATFIISLALLSFMLSDYYLSLYAGVVGNFAIVTLILYVTNNKSLGTIQKSCLYSARKLISSTVLTAVFIIVFSHAMQQPTNPSVYVSLFIFFFLVTTYYHRIERFFYNNLAFANHHNANLTSLNHNVDIALSNCYSVLDILETVTLHVEDPLQIPKHRLAINPVPLHIHQTPDAPQETYIDSRDPYFIYLEQHTSPCFIDEAPHEIRDIMEIHQYDLILPVATQGRLLGMLSITHPKGKSYLPNDTVAALIHLTESIGEHLFRVATLENISMELESSKKQLSIVELLNQYNHDIKTPLAVIDGVLSTQLYSEEKQKEIVLEQVTRCTELISVMTDLLKGNRKTNFQTVDLNAVIKQSAMLFHQRFDNVTFNFGENCKIFGDEIDLKILFVNLIKNAAEAGGVGENNLSIRSYNVSNHIKVVINDTGKGIPLNQMKDIWHIEKSEKPNGNAVGLRAVKRIAEEHSAKITVDSKEGSGTSFHLHFPLTDATDYAQASGTNM